MDRMIGYDGQHDPNLNNFPLHCSSDNNQGRSYCGASSTSSSGEGKAKAYGLPTAHSVNSEAAASRKIPGNRENREETPGNSSPPREAYYASIDEARSSAMDELFATEV